MVELLPVTRVLAYYSRTEAEPVLKAASLSIGKVIAPTTAEMFLNFSPTRRH